MAFRLFKWFRELFVDTPEPYVSFGRVQEARDRLDESINRYHEIAARHQARMEQRCREETVVPQAVTPMPPIVLRTRARQEYDSGLIYTPYVPNLPSDDEIYTIIHHAEEVSNKNHFEGHDDLFEVKEDDTTTKP